MGSCDVMRCNAMCNSYFDAFERMSGWLACHAMLSPFVVFLSLLFGTKLGNNPQRGTYLYLFLYIGYCTSLDLV